MAFYRFMAVAEGAPRRYLLPSPSSDGGAEQLGHTALLGVCLLALSSCTRHGAGLDLAHQRQSLQENICPNVCSKTHSSDTGDTKYADSCRHALGTASWLARTPCLVPGAWTSEGRRLFLREGQTPLRLQPPRGPERPKDKLGGPDPSRLTLQMCCVLSV
jgi:hypothetical protein